MPKTFALQAPQGPPQILQLPVGDMTSQLAIRAHSIAILANAFGYVQHDRHWQAVILPREFDLRLAVFGLNICRVDDCQAARR